MENERFLWMNGDIQGKLTELEQFEGKLNKNQALRLANEIVKTVNDRIKTLNPNREQISSLYRDAASAYEIAASKVALEDRDDVAFPSNYWTMRSKQILVTPERFISSHYEMDVIKVPDDKKK
jgi:hypothetical protein